jgi:hypothetical protein
MEQFMALFMPAQPVVAYESLDKVVTKNSEEYVPLKDTRNQLGYTAADEGKTKKTSVTIEGKSVVVSTIIQKGTSYIALSQLTKLGINFEKDASGVTIIK